jgi:hypothetical protein
VRRLIQAACRIPLARLRGYTASLMKDALFGVADAFLRGSQLNSSDAGTAPKVARERG